jgi:NADPH:quinone reductase-like Zn-dependent oxidoreductase
VRKVVVHAAGGYDALRVEAHPDPAPRAGEVAIDVAAAGVNYADCVVRMGLYESAKKYVGWPITPGFEVAGRVAALGEGVRDLAVGDDVFAVTRFGGYSTRVVVPRVQVLPRPGSLTVEAAAAFPSVYLTAWWALRELAHPRPGATMLVHSAAGGVGTALCGIGKILGSRVVGVVGSAHKVDAARAAGADDVIDESRGALWRDAERLAPRGYDVVLDANGPETLRASYAHLAPGGKLVVYGFHSMLPKSRGVPRWDRLAIDWLRTPRFDPFRMTGDNRSVLAFNLSYLFERTDLFTLAMGELVGWLDTGRLAPPRVTTYPFDRVADAHRAIETGTTTGKLVLVT